MLQSAFLIKIVELRSHLKEDACCYYLLEFQKDGAEAIFRGAGLDELYK